MKTRKLISLLLAVLMTVASLGFMYPSYAQGTDEDFNQRLTEEEIKQMDQFFDRQKIETEAEKIERMKFENEFFDHSKDIFYAKVPKEGEVYVCTFQAKSNELRELMNKFRDGTATKEDEHLSDQIFGTIKSTYETFQANIPTSNSSKEESEAPFAAIYQGHTDIEFRLRNNGVTESLDVMLDYEYSPQAPQYTRFTGIDYDLNPQSEYDVTTNIIGSNAYLKVTFNGSAVLQVRFMLDSSGAIELERN